MKKGLKKLLALTLALAMSLALAVSASAYYKTVDRPEYDAYGNIIGYWYTDGSYEAVNSGYDPFGTTVVDPYSGGYDPYGTTVVDPYSGGYDPYGTTIYDPYGSYYVSITSGGGTYDYGDSFTVNVSSRGVSTNYSWDYDSDYFSRSGDRFTVKYKGSSDRTARIRVSSGGYSDYVDVTLRAYRDPLSISLSSSAISLQQGGSNSLTVKASGGTTPYTYTWSSDNNAVVRVSNTDGNATVTGVTSGSTRITVTVKDKTGETRTASCTVLVQYTPKTGSFSTSAAAASGAKVPMSTMASEIAHAWAAQIGSNMNYNDTITIATVTSGNGNFVYSNGTTINSNVAFSTFSSDVSFAAKSAGIFATSYSIKNNLGDTLTGTITVTITGSAATTTPATTTPTTPAVSSTPKELVGKPAGDYFSTDIVTTVNGTPIDSINVGGKTLINAEDLNKHGFNVNWNGTQRTLSISRGGSDFSGSTVSKVSGKVGDRMGSYLYTDIVTYLDGRVIDAYNTGGKTYFCAEDMSAFGYSVIWNGSARTLTVTTQ